MKSAINWLKYQRVEQIYPANTESECSKLTLQSRLGKIWHFMLQYLTESSQLQVWHTCDEEGNIWWSAYDPNTRRSICRISEEQMRVWIERRY